MSSEKKNKKPKTEAPPEWHPFYSDPRDDVVFRSSDNLKFRASSWQLAKAR